MTVVPRVVDRATTSASWTTAPLGSVTLPVISPLPESWAKLKALQNSRKAAKRTNKVLISILLDIIFRLAADAHNAFWSVRGQTTWSASNTYSVFSQKLSSVKLRRFVNFRIRRFSDGARLRLLDGQIIVV
jgi:hypothetical protein